MSKANRVRTCLTIALVLLSAAALGAKQYLQKSRDDTAANALHVQAEYLDEKSDPLDSVMAGTPVKCGRAVKITQGEGYVRYNIELLDSDGTPLNDKLAEKLAEKEQLESMADPSLSSYRAFYEGICWAVNECNQLRAKGDLVMNTFCRSMAEGVEFDQPCSNDNLQSLTDTGDLEIGFDSDGLVILSDEAEPFSRTVIFNKKLTEGDVCPLYDYIVLPIDWEYTNSKYDGYMMNEDGDMEECYVSINNMELLGEGFGIRVTADVVDAAYYPNAVTAFKSAEKK